MSLNLHQLVSGAIGTINPFVPATVRRSTGYTTQPDGTQVPQYKTFGISAQVQALTYSDLRQLDGMNIQGVRRGVYLTGHVLGVVRPAGTGGDLIVFPDGTFPEGNTWLVAFVFEAWSQSHWCKACLTLQTDS